MKGHPGVSHEEWSRELVAKFNRATAAARKELGIAWPTGVEVPAPKGTRRAPDPHRDSKVLNLKQLSLVDSKLKIRISPRANKGPTLKTKGVT
jgi:hypothetical protein